MCWYTSILEIGPLVEFIRDRCTTDMNDTVPFWHFEEDFTEYLQAKGLRTYKKNDLRKIIQNEGYELYPNQVFKGFTKNGLWTGIVGLDLKNNKRLEKQPEVNNDNEKDSKESKRQSVLKRK